jgi:hypothetical protein
LTLIAGYYRYIEKPEIDFQKAYSLQTSLAEFEPIILYFSQHNASYNKKKHETIYLGNKSISVFEKNLRFDIVDYIFNYSGTIRFIAPALLYPSVKKLGF